MLLASYWPSIVVEIFDHLKCLQPSSVHALSAPAWSLKRAQLFFKVSSFARHPAQQGMPIMSPVMAKALVDVSAESNQGPSARSTCGSLRSALYRLNR